MKKWELETHKGKLWFPGGDVVEYEYKTFPLKRKTEDTSYDTSWFEGKSWDEIKGILATRHGVPVWRVEEIVEVYNLHRRAELINILREEL